MHFTAIDISVITLAITMIFGVKDLFHRIISLLEYPFFVRKTCNKYLAMLLLSYLHEMYKQKKPTAYGVTKALVKPLISMADVGYSVLYLNSTRLNYKGRWLWYLFDGKDRDNLNAILHNRDHYGARNLFVFEFGFIRWTINWEQLLADALNWAQSTKDRESRFAIYQVQASGVVKSKMLKDYSSSPPNMITDNHFGPTMGHVPLNWTYDQLGHEPDQSGLEYLSLSQELRNAVKEIKAWYNAKLWFHERGIPWCRKYGFEGPPGTGKTSFARAIAQELKIPLYAIDLSTMDNSELTQGWNNATENAPCMILIEDVDAVFKGRENKIEGSSLSFDCLLQCIDGVKQNNAGVLIVITSNHIDHLDSAIRRAGRMDRIIHFNELDKLGKQKIAYRIVGDHKRSVVLADMPYDNPAEFQEMCFREALQKLLEEK